MAEATLVEPNVRAGQALVRFLDEAGLKPRAALWTYASDSDSWRLWIVPPAEVEDKREFYLRLADVFAAHSDELAGLDSGEVQFAKESHPAIQGLRRIVHAPGNGALRFTNNMLNGYFLPDAIVLRMAI